MIRSMSAIWPYFLISLATAYLSDRGSAYQMKIGEKVKFHRDYFFFFLTAVTMSLFVGLRLWCNDTGEYLAIYTYLTPDQGSIFDIPDWSLGENPGFLILNRILKHLHFSNQNYLMFFACFTNFTYLWFLKKYSKNFFLSVFLIWTMGTYIFTAAAIKQTLAIALGLIGVDFFLKGKKGYFLLFILLGMTIHPYVALFFIVPFLFFPPWTKKTYWLLGIFALTGVSLQFLLRTIVSVANIFGEPYSVEEFAGAGVNVFRLAVVWAPVVLSLFVRERMKKSEDRENNLFMNLSMLNAEIMFVALFGTANYFARLANYFQIFQAISIPWMLQIFSKKNRKEFTIFIMICYFAYFIVANTIMTPFNRYFAKMPLWEYLESLF